MIFLFPWSISRQLEAHRPSSEEPRSLSRCSGSWQSPHGGTATQRPGLSPLFSWGQVVTAARGAGKLNPARAGEGWLHPVCMSLEPCRTARQGAGIPPFTKTPALSRAWLCLHQCCWQKPHLPLAAGDTRLMLESAADQDVPTAPFAAARRFKFKEDEDPVSSTQPKGQAASG